MNRPAIPKTKLRQEADCSDDTRKAFGYFSFVPPYPNLPPDANLPIELPINGVLDLHGFRPPEVGELVADYLDACSAKGIETVRIIHGKGIGNLRRTVHAVLSRHPSVEGFALAGEAMGGWGATMVQLQRGIKR